MFGKVKSNNRDRICSFKAKNVSLEGENLFSKSQLSLTWKILGDHRIKLIHLQHPALDVLVLYQTWKNPLLMEKCRTFSLVQEPELSCTFAAALISLPFALQLSQSLGFLHCQGLLPDPHWAQGKVGSGPSTLECDAWIESAPHIDPAKCHNAPGFCSLGIF